MGLSFGSGGRTEGSPETTLGPFLSYSPRISMKVSLTGPSFITITPGIFFLLSERLFLSITSLSLATLYSLNDEALKYFLSSSIC